jgi:predicted ATPase
MRIDQLIKQFNRELASTFGRNPHGGANYKWANTREFNAFEEAGMNLVQPVAADGVVIEAQMSYRAIPWADLMGARWCVVKWEHRDQETWRTAYGNSLPWPKHGEYVAISSSLMPIGAEPDEYDHQQLLYRLSRHLGMTRAEHIAAPHAIIAAQDKERRRVIHDMVQDATLPFNHIPGAKDSVSVPTNKQTQGKGALE